MIAFSFFFFRDQYANYIDISDEGFLAYGAARALEGQLPNRDFFSLQPPLSFYVAACAFKLLGPSVHSLRVLGFALHFIVVGLTYLICRRFAKPLAALAAALPAVFIGLPFFSFAPFAVWHGIVFSLGAVFFFLGYLSRPRPYWLFGSGFLTGLVVLSRHDQGFYSAFAVALCFFVMFLKSDADGRLPLLKDCFLWTVGILTPVLPTVLWAAYSGAAQPMLEQLILFPLKTYSRTSSVPMPRFDLSQDFGYNAFAAFFYLPGFAALSAALVGIVRGFRKTAADFPIGHFYIAILSLGFYLQALTRSDLNHLIITLPPFFILMGLILSTSIQFFSDVIRRRVRSLSDVAEETSAFLLSGAFIAAFFLVFANCRDKLINRAPINPQKISLPKAGVVADGDTCRTIETVVGIIQKYSRKDQSILVLPYQPMIYFLAERRNPTRWNYLWPGDQSEADHRRLVEEARSDPPALVLLFDRESLRTYAPRVVDYVEADHALQSEGAGMSLYLPKSRE